MRDEALTTFLALETLRVSAFPKPNLCAKVPTYMPGKLFWPTSMLVEERRRAPGDLANAGITSLTLMADEIGFDRVEKVPPAQRASRHRTRAGVTVVDPTRRP